MTPERVRWRLNEPCDEQAVRWTKAHILIGPYETACHIKVPEWPYDRDANEQIPAGVELCKRCAKSPAALVPKWRHEAETWFDDAGETGEAVCNRLANELEAVLMKKKR